mgnify:CR=1 FL=1
MPSAIPTFSTPATIPKTNVFVRVQPGSGWANAWSYVPFLRFQYCRDGLGPNMPKAGFVFDFGLQKREHTKNFFTELPQSLAGYYVQILLQTEGYPAYPAWHGTFPEDLVRLDSDIRLEGQQSLTAYGLAHLLDLQPIDRSYCEQDGAVVESRRLLKFNERSDWGTQLVGNRSNGKHNVAGTSPVVKTYVFSGKANRTTWSNRDIAEYLLYRFPPKGLTLPLIGLAAAADSLKDVHDPAKWKSTWSALDDLFSRRKGLSYQLMTPGFGPIGVWVDSLSEIPISYGGFTLPANSNPVVFTLPTAYPWNQLIAPLNFRFSQLAQFDELLVESEELIRIMASVSYEPRGKLTGAAANLRGDGTLVEGWKSTIETTVKTPGGANAVENDNSRDDDRFRDVFRSHLIANDRNDPTKFDWLFGDGIGGPKTNMAITAKDDGTVDLTKKSPVFNAERTLLRELPIEQGKKYDVNPIVNEQVTERTPEFQPLLAVMRDPLAVDGAGAAKEFYYLIDKPAEGGPPSVGVAPLDRALGINLHTTHPQTLARDHWAGAAATQHAQELDYRDLIATIALETDQRLRVRIQNLSWPQHHTNRKYRVTMPNVHYWRAAPGTVLGTDKGALKKIDSKNLKIRDDGDKLKAFAAFLRYFFGVHRQAVEIPIALLGTFAPLGSMIVGISGVGLWQPILTVVDSRTITRSGTGEDEKVETMLSTGFWSLEEAKGLFS